MSSDRIRDLNDAFRTSLSPLLGRVIMTSTVAALPAADRAAIFEKIRTFADFSDDNDPYGEHDFIRIEHNGRTYYGKIDYFDVDLQHGSPDPSDPTETLRVLMIMDIADY